MKYLSVRIFLVVALGAVGCAVGTAPDLTAEDLGAATGPDGSTSQLPDGRAPLPGADAAPATDAGGDAAPVKDAAPDSPVTSACAFTGELVRFDLNAASGAQANLAPTSSAKGVTAGVLKRGGVTVVSTNQAMNASGWPTSTAVDLSKHFTFSITPPAGCAVTVTSLSVQLQASGTGPKSAAAGTSVDGFSARTNVPITSSATVVTLPGSAKSTSALELRVFGFDADASGGTLRLEGALSVTGTLGAP